jgi:hypothetical protein
VKLTYPVVEREPSDPILKAVEEQMVLALGYGGERNTTLDEAVEDFLDSYEDFRKSFPASATDWEIEVVAEKVFESDKVLTVKLSSYAYMGGAHPNSFVNYFNFDLEKGGKLLSTPELLLNREKMLALTEQKFREFHGISKDTDLRDDDRFFIEEAGFFLPQAIGYENDGWMMVYNPYEIGPYVMGYTELRFTLNEVKDVVKFPF